jgi:hypothetical protein
MHGGNSSSCCDGKKNLLIEMCFHMRHQNASYDANKPTDYARQYNQGVVKRAIPARDI